MSADVLWDDEPTVPADTVVDAPALAAAGRVVDLEDATRAEYVRIKARQAAADQVAAESAPPLRRLGRRHIADLVKQAVEETAVRHEYGVQGFRTGIASVDEHLLRAMGPDRTIGIAADTKGGKTTLAGQILCALAAQGVPGLLGSFEDEQTDTVLRYIANLSSGNVGTIRDGFRRPDGTKLSIPADFDTAADKLSALGIEVIAETGTVEQIAYETDDWWKTQAAAGHPFGVLVLDQLSHIVPSDRAAFAQQFPGYPPPPHVDNTVAMLEWQVAMLNRIAAKLNLLIIVLHQLNNDRKEWEKPSHLNLRGSKAIGHKLDALIIPWRPSKLRNENRGLGEPEWVENTEGRSWILCPIGRQVQPFDVEVQWDGPGQRYLDKDADRRAPWSGPAAPTAEQLEGMSVLARLKGGWRADTQRVQALANGVVDQAALPAGPATPRQLLKLATAPATVYAPQEPMAGPFDAAMSAGDDAAPWVPGDATGWF